MRAHLKLFATLVGFLIAQIAAGQPAGVEEGEPKIGVSLHWSQNGVEPGGQIALAVVLDIPEPYHVNANTARGNFIPTTVQVVDAPNSVRSSTAIFPNPTQIKFGTPPNTELIDVFSGRTIIYLSLAATEDAPPGPAIVRVQVSFQPCDDLLCYFQQSNVYSSQLEVLSPGTKAEQINPDIFAAMSTLRERLQIPFFGWDFAINPSQLWLLLIVASAGGLLLNFTPCVLPLVPIKIMGLSRAAGDRRRCLLLGLAMSVGIVAFWLGLAVAISTISGFNATNKLFQYPAFTISVGLIICAMAVGMCGLFAVRLPDWIYRINPSHDSAGGSFVFGIMTAVLSTPCTAPFMGAAAAWAATQAATVTLATFSAIGMGMALPYLLLSAFPKLVNRMPRTGPASELIKHVMGLLMLAAGAYFLGTGLAGWMASPPDPPTQIYWWPVALFIGAAGVWLMWRTFRITSRWSSRVIFGTVGFLLVMVGAGVGIKFTQGSPIHWIYYTPERLGQAQQQQKVIVLEFTAAWCLNCRALEQAVLHQDEVVALLNSEDVAPIKIDLTGRNPPGSDKLVEVGRRSIPYLIIYGRDGQQTLASDAYTIDQLVQAVRKARSVPAGK